MSAASNSFTLGSLTERTKLTVNTTSRISTTPSKFTSPAKRSVIGPIENRLISSIPASTIDPPEPNSPSWKTSCHLRHY